MSITERRSNRGRIQIMGDMLGLATAGIRKTHIMYRANLSYDQAVTYLEELMGRGMIAPYSTDDGIIYRTTEKGREFLNCYNRITEFLEAPQRLEAACTS